MRPITKSSKIHFIGTSVNGRPWVSKTHDRGPIPLVPARMDQYKFKKGITEDQIEQLVKYAQTDPDVINNTADTTRFKDKETFKEWIKIKNATIYTLSDSEQHLLGIVWVHPKPFPERDFTREFNPSDYPETIAIRMYGEARGKGLAFDFIKKAIQDYGKVNMWAETTQDNSAAVKLSHKLGFEQVSKADENGKIIMIVEAKNLP